MNTLLKRNWWIFLFRGICAVLLGLAALIIPGITLNSLLIMPGAFLFVQSLLTGMSVIAIYKSVPGWQWILLFAGLCLLAGMVIVLNPFATAVLLMYLLGTCLFLAGLSEIVMAVRLRKAIKGESWYIFAGFLAVLLALYMFLDPSGTFIILTVLFGIYAITAGILLLFLAFRLKKSILT